MTKRETRKRYLHTVTAAFVLTLLFTAYPAQAQTDASRLRIPDEMQTEVPGPAILRNGNQVEVWVKLADPPLVTVNGANAKKAGGKLNGGQQRDYVRQIHQKQDALMTQIRNMGGVELARVAKSYNAIAVSIPAAKAVALSALSGVVSVQGVRNYQATLSATRSYIGAVDAENAGFDGTGVTIGLLDTGIDYTHRDFGGPGTLAAYTDAYGTSTTDARNTRRDGLFPTSKVIEGYDFVGEVWPNGPLAPDDDPIGCGGPIACDGGHGTHTADIAAGRSADGTHKGIAPGASIVAIKVCSAVSNACSGIAILQGLDFALDPNGDGDISDAVDVINMSLGSSYGQREDALSEAAQNTVDFGVVVVVAAGNDGDRPYIVSSPSIAPGVLSVAASFHPTAKLYLVSSSATSSKGALWQSWSALPTLVSGVLRYDTTNANTRRGCTNATGASPWTGTPLAGQIALIDRGTCAISVKVSNAAAAGAIAAVIANNVSQPVCDLPLTFSFGGGTPAIAGYVITLADGNVLKATALGATATINPANAVGLAGNMAGFSSRGPTMSNNSIKPDITGVGTDILSAEAGTGSGETPFSGTSGSTPVLAGSAALLVQKYPTWETSEIKAALMNAAATNVGLNPVACAGLVAPITRTGAGEVRVKKSLDLKTGVWDNDDGSPSLSFGYQALADRRSFLKKVLVRNYANTTRTYAIGAAFRDAADAASGAVTLDMPASITVPANGSRAFNVKLAVDPSRLPVWTLNGGNRGGDGFRLQDFEFDGAITVHDAIDNASIPFQILPHRSAVVTPATTEVQLKSGTATLPLSNAEGAVDGSVDVFSLLGTSGRVPPPRLPGPGDDFAVVDLKSVGARLVPLGGGQFGMQFAMNTFGARSHPNYPAEFDIFIDVNRDGTDDFVIFNVENGGFAATGQNVVAAGPLPNGPFRVMFFTDADLDSSNAIFTVPLSSIGLTETTQFNFSVLAFDNYFTGNLTDAILGMTYTPATPRFVGSGIPDTGVPAGGSSTLTINSVPGGDAASPSQQGLLLMYRDARSQRQADAVTVKP